MNNDRELEEAHHLIDQLLGISCLEVMIKDLNKGEKPEDEELMLMLMLLRGRAKDFLEKHAKKKGETA